MTVIILFVFGLVVGSFLNVVTIRYQLGGRILATSRIGGRSHCPKCQSTLRWYELLPLLSFVFQGGKCRHCDYRLSWQYPVVEFISGILTAAIPLFFYNQFKVAIAAASGEYLLWYFGLCAIWLIAAYTFLVLSIIDLKYTIIPDAANILLTVLGIAAVAIKTLYGSEMGYNGSFLGSYALAIPIDDLAWVQALAAAGLGALLFGGIITLTRGRGMGLGDLKLIIPVGLLMGWPDIIFVLAGSFIIGAALSLILMAIGKKSFKDGVPFGPFIALAVFVIMFYGEALMAWYFTLI